MTSVFGADYAAAYDLLYAEKDYGAECDVLERTFNRSGQSVKTILDLGCGTGRHAAILSQRGYGVTGVDMSADMLEQARTRAGAATPRNVEFVLGDVRTLRLERTFDAVICMFAVLGYQTTDHDLSRTLASVRRHLAPGGTFVFDVWYGPAVTAVGPERRTKMIRTGDGEVERQAFAAVDTDRSICTVSYRLTVRRHGQGDRVAEETHRMRYYFREELDGFLRDAGLALVDLTSFPEVAREPSSSTWNVLATARG